MLACLSHRVHCRHGFVESWGRTRMAQAGLELPRLRALESRLGRLEDGVQQAQDTLQLRPERPGSLGPRLRHPAPSRFACPRRAHSPLAQSPPKNCLFDRSKGGQSAEWAGLSKPIQICQSRLDIGFDQVARIELNVHKVLSDYPGLGSRKNLTLGPEKHEAVLPGQGVVLVCPHRKPKFRVSRIQKKMWYCDTAITPDVDPTRYRYTQDWQVGIPMKNTSDRNHSRSATSQRLLKSN